MADRQLFDTSAHESLQTFIMKRKALAVVLLLVTSALVLRWADPYPPPPDDVRVQAAIDAIEGGDLGTFDAIVTEIRQTGGHSDHLVLLSGLRHLRFGRADIALSRFRSLVPEGKLRQQLMRYTAETLHQLNRKVEALDLLRTVLEQNPDDMAAHRWAAITCFDLGAHDVAIPHLNQLIEFDPSDFRPFRTLGEIYSEMQLDEQAIKALIETLNRNPPADIRQDVCARLAECLLRQRRFDETLKYLDQAVRSIDSITIRGQCLLSLGRNLEAAAALSEAKAMDPEALPVLLLSAALHATDGNHEFEIGDLETACRLYPYEPSASYQLALALRNGGHEQQAKAEMERYQELSRLTAELSSKSQQMLSDSSNASLRAELAEICEQLGRHDLAESWRSAAAGMRWAEAVTDPTE